MSEKADCLVCGGEGEVMTAGGIVEPCEHCGGLGFVWVN